MSTKKIAAFLFFFLFGLCLSPFPGARAQEGREAAAHGVPPAFRSTAYPLPRFASVGSDQVFVRTGPGQRYPVEWEYTRKGVPVEIILEYDVWRKIRDFSGQVGWVHHTLLSGRRSAFVLGGEPAPLHRKPDAGSPLQALAEQKSLLDVESCNGAWCFVNASGYKGWLEQNKLWGVYETEVFD